jgi:hypothetical protein
MFHLVLIQPQKQQREVNPMFTYLYSDQACGNGKGKAAICLQTIRIFTHFSSEQIHTVSCGFLGCDAIGLVGGNHIILT